MENIIYITIVMLSLIFIVKYFKRIAKFFFGGNDLKNPNGELLKIIVQVLGGIILLFGAYYSLKIADSMNDNNKLIEKGNIATRFKNAIEMLDNANSNTCLGGVYALRNIAVDNYEYREQVFNILVEFINIKTKSLPSWNKIANSQKIIAQPSIEIKTILKILFSKENLLFSNYFAHFNAAKLYGGKYDHYNFSHCKFENVEFQNSSFQSTLFIESEIYNSDFSFSTFPNTIFNQTIMMNNSKFACCNFAWTRFRKGFIQETDFSCSSMRNVFFDGALVNACNFDGVELITSYGENGGSFIGSSFSSISIKGLQCFGKGIIARGAKFEIGVPFPPTFRLENFVGKKAKINIKNKLEDFPNSKLIYYKNLIGDYLNTKSDGGTLINLDHDVHKTTGWVFADTSIFTVNDLENINRLYDKDIKKITKFVEKINDH